VLGRVGLATLLMTGLCGCASSAVSVNSYRDPALGRERYATYAWGSPDALPVGDPRLDNDADFRERLEGAIDRELLRKGYRHDEQADFLVHYHASIADRLDVTRLDDLHFDCAAGSCDTDLIEYEAGTFVIDVVDARTNRLVWRGWAQDRIAPALGDRNRMFQLVDDAVRRMLDRFPTR
jgi:hypothetical protein